MQVKDDLVRERKCLGFERKWFNNINLRRVGKHDLGSLILLLNMIMLLWFFCPRLGTVWVKKINFF